MIIEATQTFSPGNVELLIYILNRAESRKINTKVYIGHASVYDKLNKLKYQYVCIEKSSGFKTIVRFLKFRNSVLFFCSYPPIVRSRNSIVYFHSSFFINPFKFIKDKKLSNKTKFTRLFVFYLIKFFNKNVDFFYCQTEEIEKQLKSSFKGIKVKKMPFYNDIELNSLSHKNNNTFLYDFFYPATPDIHKNLFRLFEAVEIIFQKRKVRICVTINPKATRYIDEINRINHKLQFEAIVNVGRIEKIKVLELYLSSKALIFPSLEESLGLPLIEAATISCPIIGSNLPYIYDVVESPIVFNPNDSKDIVDKMNRFLNGEYNDYQQKNKIENKIDEIINYFI